MIKTCCFCVDSLVPVSVGSGRELFWTHCTLEKVHFHVFISVFDLPYMSIPAVPILKSLATERTTIFLITFVCFNSLHTGLSVHNQIPMGLIPIDTVHWTPPLHCQTHDIFTHDKSSFLTLCSIYTP